MKFSVRQILASAAGAVIAAVIASSFGVKGTIVGVAIGSAAATMATAFVAQSIERGHEAVKQVVVRAPDTSTLLRKLGGTGASGDASSSSDAAAPTEVVGRSAADTGGVADAIAMTSSPVAETERLEISAVADAPATERLRATTLPPARPGPRRPGVPPRFSWGAIAATIGIVFVLALLFITAIELISGKPLADIFGNAGSGTTLNGVFTPSPPPPASPTTTTPPTSTSSSTSTTTSTTSTTLPAANQTTTTTSPSASTTTSTAGGVQSTTTTLVPQP